MTRDLSIKQWIARACEVDIDLSKSDFVMIDGDPTIDGMDPGEWLDAMCME